MLRELCSFAAPSHSRRRPRRRPLALFGTAAFFYSITAHSAAGQEFFEAAREFVVERACAAYDGFKRQSNPVALEPGRSYPGRGVNKRDGASHVLVVVGGGNKWVALECGRFTDGGGAFPGVGPSPDARERQNPPSAPNEIGHPKAQSSPNEIEHSKAQSAPDEIGHPKAQSAPDARGHPKAQPKCLPFFDTIDNPVTVKVGGKVDISPPPPVLDAFDAALTHACGSPGKTVPADEFKALLRAHPEVLERIKSFTGSKVFSDRPPRTETAAYIEDLAEAWFAVKAFDHILCGEPGGGRGKIGGMHFHARYLQLQQSGEACLMGNYAQNEVVPGVLYTTGVVMRLADGREIRDARKGYGLTLGGEDLLKLVTRAFAENPTPSAESSACLLPVRDDGHHFTAVFVRRAAGIRTFYPDATPSPREPRCAAPIALQ